MQDMVLAHFFTPLSAEYEGASGHFLSKLVDHGTRAGHGGSCSKTWVGAKPGALQTGGVVVHLQRCAERI